ncbi:MAG: MaoC family dehydratase [Defluviicoccus sp.]|nr:MaoC family dehydratase [Defluviicoccus sp.]MDG4592558.1 MaoC family dehydratase [Defluviicoccus sp.]
MGATMATKTNPGNYFEDFRLGQEIRHATPRTITSGDMALYTALYGTRFAVNSSDEFARGLGLPRAPIDDILAFHIVFGKTVPDISLNAVANLGYASGSFGEPVYVGDTVSTTSTVIGLRQNKDGASGIVYVRSIGTNQRREMVLDYCRWVMVRKRNVDAPVQSSVIPDLPDAVQGGDLIVPHKIHIGSYDFDLAGSRFVWDDYEQGEKIDHVDGMTIEEAEHMMATRLYQNTAKVHFDALMQKGSRFGRRLIYGGHIISLARAISFNGLANAFKVAAINGGRHVAPTFAGDTIYAWSEVVAKTELSGRRDVGALRLRTVATKDKPCADFPYKDSAGTYDPAVVLDFDYTVLLPKRV